MASSMQFNPVETPLVILAEGCFGAHQSKTGLGVIRYGQWPITAVLDSQQAGKTVRQATGIAHDAPIIAMLEEALNLSPKPKALLVGTAPMGGDLPSQYRDVIREAITKGLHIISGLHIFLNEDPELRALAQQYQVHLWDVRATTNENIITRQLPRPSGTHVITMVGTDCSVGKMTVALELNNALQKRGEASVFVATGQTGIMITGSGVPLDRVIGDFMAGTLEQEIDDVIKASHPRWVIVEGQGSLLHPAYSGVTMSLLHGSAPDAMILCHNTKLKTINNFDSVPLPSLSRFVEIYESAASWIKPAKVVGISLNTSTLAEDDARAAIAKAQAETGLPATDPVRFGVDGLVEALVNTF